MSVCLSQFRNLPNTPSPLQLCSFPHRWQEFMCNVFKNAKYCATIMEQHGGFES